VHKAHQTALRFAAIMRRAATGELSAVDARSIANTRFVVPAAWRKPAEPPPMLGVDPPQPKRTDKRETVGQRGSGVSATGPTSVEVAPAAVLAHLAQSMDSAVSDAESLQRILVHAALLSDSGKISPADFEAKFIKALKTRLSGPDKTILQTTLQGRRFTDITDLIADLETNSKAKLTTANELCHQIDVFEDDQTQSLPPAREPTSENRPAIRALGWGDLMVVREELVGYEAGEIPHIENVLAGESTTRKHDRRHETQTLTEDETLTESTTENQHATTDRFEVQSESATAIATDFSVAAGVNTSGKYGLTTVETSVAGELARSSDESTRSATTMAQEVVDVAVKRTRTMTRALRRTMTTDTLRDRTIRGIDNTRAAVERPEPRSGIYQWIDKVQRLQLYQYGKRMMIEFIIPEPGLSLIEAGQPVRPGHGKSTEPLFGNPIGWKPAPRIGAVNHLSIAKTRCRSVWTKDHSPLTDSCSMAWGSACALVIVLAHSSWRAAHAARMPSGSIGRSIARNGYHGSRSFTYAVTSTPLMTTLSTSASMSTLTSHAWLIFASVRLTSRKRAPLRSAPQNTAPPRSPSNSCGMLPPVPPLR